MNGKGEREGGVEEEAEDEGELGEMHDECRVRSSVDIGCRSWCNWQETQLLDEAIISWVQEECGPIGAVLFAVMV